MLCNTKVGFPVFDSVENPFESSSFLLCGGGGSSKSGVPNKVLLGTLGPRPDGHAGVSVLELESVDFSTEVPTKCAFVNAQLVVVAINTCIHFYRPNNNKALEEKTGLKIQVGELIEVLRSFQEHVFAGTESGRFLVYSSTQPQTLLFSSSLHWKAVKDISFYPGAVATCSEDGTVRVWHDSDQKEEIYSCRHILPAKQELMFRKVRFLPGNRVVALQIQRKLKGASLVTLWRKVGEEYELELCKEVAPMLTTALAVNTKFVAVATPEYIQVLDLDNKLKLIKHVNKVHGLPVTGLFFRNEYLVSTSADATVAMIRMEDVTQGFSWTGVIVFLVKFVFLLAVMVWGFVMILLLAKGVDDIRNWKVVLDSTVEMDFTRVEWSRAKLLLEPLLSQ